MATENKVENNAKKNTDDTKKNPFWSALRETTLTKLQRAYWSRLIIVIALLFSIPHYLKSFFPIPDQAKQDWLWTSVPSIPWIYLLVLVIRGVILIFLVWAVVKLVVSDE